MKRNNMVVLFGKLKLTAIRFLPKLLAAECRIVTDEPALGGEHLVIADSKTAREMVAFELTARSLHTELIATVLGWLFSGYGQARVVAEQMHFHVTPDVRVYAAQVLKNLPEQTLPERVSFNGTEIEIRETLKDVKIV